eukprot:scaffold55_cov39-Phaeocystis_antarctica.AAC.1
MAARSSPSSSTTVRTMVESLSKARPALRGSRPVSPGFKPCVAYGRGSLLSSIVASRLTIGCGTTSEREARY